MTARIGLLVAINFFCGILLLAFAEASATPDAKPPMPKLATLPEGPLPLADALRKLTEQTSEPVADRIGAPDPVVDLNLHQTPFWDALDALAEKANGRVDLHGPGGIAVVKCPADWKPPLISHSGLFRTALSTVTAKVDLETGARTYTASLEVAWESHLLPILLETHPNGVVVRDEAGRLLPAAAAGSSLAPVDGRIALAFDEPLPPLARSVRSLSLLEGRLYAVAPTKMLTFAFHSVDQLAKAAAGDPRLSQTQEEVACRVSRLVVAEDHWSAEITLDYPEGNVKLDSYQSWVVNNELVLRRGEDRFPSSSYLLEESTPRHAVLTYNFSDQEKMKGGPAGWDLVYRTPALVVKVPFTFSFKDVPLP